MATRDRASSERKTDPPPEVLVLGSTRHPRYVTSLAWAGLSGYINFADYDVVIINLAGLREIDDVSAVGSAPQAPAVGRTLFSPDTEVVVIRDYVEHEAVDNWFWSPIRLTTVHEPGLVIQAVNADWSWYFDRLPAYADYFTGGYSEAWPARSYFGLLSIPANVYGVAVEPLAASRDGRPVAVAAQFVAKMEDAYSVAEVARSSMVYVLPTLYDLPASDVANLILQERYGLEITTPAPDWSRSYVLPSHAPALDELAAVRKTIADAQELVPEAEKTEAHAARFQALLYEGDDALEPLVWEALRHLGGTVVEPLKKGAEDGRVTSPDGTLYMIEIKGLTGPVKRAHVRQLQDWVTAAQTDEDLDCRGLLVANVYRGKPPNERQPAVTGDVARAAQRVSHAVLTTTQLFAAMGNLERGALTEHDFWQAITEAHGFAGLPELDQQVG